VVHEKRKDHACPHCAAAFGKASDLTRHVQQGPRLVAFRFFTDGEPPAYPGRSRQACHALFRKALQEAGGDDHAA
jgi:hypothetical protein